MPLHGKHRHVRRHLNWRIALLFALGASLFIVGGILSLTPQQAVAIGFDSTAVNLVFFCGSIPFTAAAYLQLYQAANAAKSPAAASSDSEIVWVGWRPRELNWLSCALQFLGTLMFNVNTFDAMYTWSGSMQNFAVWVPDAVGSILFLTSALLAYIDCVRAPGAWRPRSLEWWICIANLVGCIAFMASALFAFVPAGGQTAEALNWSLVTTVFGAVGFLVGGLLLLSEPDESLRTNMSFASHE
ncbi:MAG: hypothetical protein AAGI44_08010 [Pseudomonadota bacterium]